MIAKDKSGKNIYPSVFNKIQKNGTILIKCGYTESVAKPNLFYKKISDGIFFADMRGTEEVPIWESTAPAFWGNLDKNIEKWNKRRILLVEIKHLAKEGCKCRVHFYFGDSDPFEKWHGQFIFADENTGHYEWPAGYCAICNKDFQNEGLTCSNDCKEKFLDSISEKCIACKKRINCGEEVYHHTSYFPERKVPVHKNCHQKIHRTEEYLDLKPDVEEIKKFYKR